MLWRKSNADIPVLAQTWSDPRVHARQGPRDARADHGSRLRRRRGRATSPGTATMGNAVLVLDALDGSLLKTLATDRPVPASVALLDSDFDGYTDRA
jgi:type IV pilus assembly protein PilY1